MRIGCKAQGGAAWCGEQEEVSGQSAPEAQCDVGVREGEWLPLGL